MHEVDGPVAEPIVRRGYDVAELMERHPPLIENERKRLIASIANPSGAVHSGRVDVSRWAAMQLPAHAATVEAHGLLEVRDGWFEYGDARPKVAPEDARQRVATTHWHVNFADTQLFGFYGDGFFAQDEVQVAEHPVLASVRQALLAEGLAALTIERGEPTPVLVRGAARRVAIDTARNAEAGRPHGIYGGRNLHAVSVAALRDAIHPLDPPTITNVIAIAARAHGFGRYHPDQIDFMLRAAYTGFRAAVLESRRAQVGGGGAAPASEHVPAGKLAPEVVVHSGFWGCGAFGGNRVMMTLLQLMAAQMAGVDRLIYYVGEPKGRPPVERALALARNLAPITETTALLDAIEALGLEWGNSNGT